jgi:tRNA A-37 threonylcarbamoyl transferase component Bud32
MKNITQQEYQQLLQTSRLLEKDAYGPKVLLTADHLIIKLFRRKRFFSKTLLFPAGKRFATNARELKKRGIDTVTVEDYGRCDDPPRDIVWYRYLEGQPLRDVCLASEPAELALLVEQLGAFVALLHQRGVLFRSLHWNNILVQPCGRLALIDILDLRVQRRPLNRFQRQRNFSHLLCRNKEDLHLYLGNSEFFWKGYATESNLSPAQLDRLKQLDLSSRKGMLKEMIVIP